MSLQISITGTREGVLKHIALAPDKLPPGTDQAQVTAVTALLQSEIAALPSKSNGLRLNVDASAPPNGPRAIQIQLIPLTLHV